MLILYVWNGFENPFSNCSINLKIFLKKDKYILAIKSVRQLHKRLLFIVSGGGFLIAIPSVSILAVNYKTAAANGNHTQPHFFIIFFILPVFCSFDQLHVKRKNVIWRTPSVTPRKPFESACSSFHRCKRMFGPEISLQGCWLVEQGWAARCRSWQVSYTGSAQIQPGWRCWKYGSQSALLGAFLNFFWEEVGLLRRWLASSLHCGGICPLLWTWSDSGRVCEKALIPKLNYISCILQILGESKSAHSIFFCVAKRFQKSIQHTSISFSYFVKKTTQSFLDVYWLCSSCTVYYKKSILFAVFSW